MKAEELRIGNYIQDINYPTRECRVFRLTSGVDFSIAYSYGKCYESSYANDRSGALQPIPLTEEWLLKFGLFKKGVGYINFDGSEFCCYKLNSGNGFGLYFNDEFLGITIKYVHQLQNLYFALTGNELTI